ncbi:hypothetical protein LZ554_002328 [Drepanopeziza brunnea f. sp. 'monogermtubi']|nr:hypothetical protein LZ554_002328 [Drepanopeziza brunnea f. sp. 'monogermtubi']
MKFSRIAVLGAATLAVAQPHNHVHKHPVRQNGSPVEGRDAHTTTTVPGAIVTVYELNGEFIPWDEVEAGILNGKYVLNGDKVTSILTPSSTATPSPPSSPAAVFLEKKPITSTTPVPAYVPVLPTTSKTPTPTPTPTPSTTPDAQPADGNSSYPVASGIDSDFPSGKVDCNDFATLEKYGAVPADYLGLNGYTGIQITPSYSIGAEVISYIQTAIAGQTCVKNSFCSYACPAGYQKAQWPAAQGHTGQSIGGLYCNSQGKLELTRDGYKTLCQKGVGGVEATNSLKKNVAVCRTDYPGTESETVGVDVGPGSTVPVTCPDANTYYTWQGMSTTAQYYINPSGYTKEQACLWGEAGSNIGNWAPVNMGLGRSTSGQTFLSLFPNKPTNPDGVLDFNIKITGDVNGQCTYIDGKFYNNGNESPTGCTVAVTGDALVQFY